MTTNTHPSPIEARRLHDEAGAMTMQQMRDQAAKYGQGFGAKLARAELLYAFRQWLEPFTKADKPQPTDEDGGFEDLRQKVAARFAAIPPGTPIFRATLGNAGVSAGEDGHIDLHRLFISRLPIPLQQHYTCNCCRGFINRYAGLVTISADGKVEPVLWPAGKDVPPTFSHAMDKFRDLFRDHDPNHPVVIESVFITDEINHGTAQTGPWTHLYFQVPRARLYTGIVESAAQKAAAIREDKGMLKRALANYPKPIVERALALLKSGTFYRSDKCEAIATWLLEQYGKSDRLLWLAAATAPAGFCHVTSGMIGTLLDDLVAGYDVEAVRARFAQKMDPANYQRAQVAPSAGNVAQAEAIIAKLDAAGSLKRAYATLAGIPGSAFLWRDPGRQIGKDVAGGVFGHLAVKAKQPKADAPVLPQQTITWVKFLDKVLPGALSVEVQMPASTDRLMALVAAADLEAPGIFQWTNPFSWYYAAGIDGEIKRRVLAMGGKHEGCAIRASLLWNNRSDFDLHCNSPEGYIYFANKRVGNGWLDVDMNVQTYGAHSSDTPVENIRWTAGTARPGRYRFSVNNYTERGSGGPTPFKVELEVNGQIFYYDGMMPYSNFRGNSNATIEVVEFDYTPGQPPRFLPGRSMRAAIADGWGTQRGAFVKVNAIVPSPNLWGETPCRNQGEHIFFLLDGVKDSAAGVGRGFFTEMLRSEFHPIRSTLEAYNATATIAGAEQADACGLGFTNQAPWGLVVRVKTGDAIGTYLIDRYD